MKKLLCLLMVLSFVIAAFAGCGPRPSSIDASSQISSTPAPSKPSSSKPVSSIPSSSSEVSSTPSSSAPSSSSKPASSKPTGNTGGGTYKPPASSTPTPISTTTIRSGNTYSNKSYGNLLLHSDVEDDVVTLENVKITGTLIIEGGTEVELIDSTVNQVEVNRYGQAVTIFAEGKTTVNTLTAKSNVVLDESALSSGYKGFKKVITADNPHYYFIDVVLEDTDLDSAVLNTRTQLTENGSSDVTRITNKDNLYTYEPSFGGGGGGGSSYYSSTKITNANAVLNGGTYRDITITSAVGDGDVTLNNVRILGTLYVNGGGQNSIMLTGTTSAAKVVVNKQFTSGATELPSVRLLDLASRVGEIIVTSNMHSFISYSSSPTSMTINNGLTVNGLFGGGLGALNISTGVGSIINQAAFGGTGSINGNGTVGSLIAQAGSVTVASSVRAPAPTLPTDMTVTSNEVLSQTTVKITMPELKDISFRWNNTTLIKEKVSYANNAYTLTVPSMTGGNTNSLVISAPKYNPKTVSLVWYAPTQKAVVNFLNNPSDLTLQVKKNGVAIAPESGSVYKLEPGNYTYTASKSGFATETDVAFTVTLAEVTSGKVINVKLAPATATVTFKKTPTDLGIVVKKGSTVITAQADGTYKLEAGDYTYTATKQGYETKTDVDFTVTLAEVTGGKVINVNLAPATATVTFKKTPTDLGIVVKKGLTEIAAQADGTYKLEAGDYTYTATKDGYQPKENEAFTVLPANLNGNMSIDVALAQIPPAVTNVAITGPATVNVGETITLKASVLPAEANQAVNWSTDNQAIATVSTSGLVTGKATGTVKITATTVDGSKTSIHDVAVVDTIAPTVGAITATTADNSIVFTVGDNAGVIKIEVDSTIYGENDAVIMKDFDFNFALPLTATDTNLASTYGMTVSNTNGTIKIAITNYTTFKNKINEVLNINSGSQLTPVKIHFWVVAHDASGNVSGHMGYPNVPATARQVDLTLKTN